MLQIDPGQEVPFLILMGWPVNLHSPIMTERLKADVSRA